MTINTDEKARAAGAFIDLVQRTREAQKDYYRTRDPMKLAHAKRLERDVDAQLEAWEWERVRAEAREKHPELFPGE
jgi:hypothetical protein